jgi:hypothetical protein
MRRLLHGAFFAVVATGLLSGAAWWGIPALLLTQIPARLSQLLRRPVSLEAVQFEPGPLVTLPPKNVLHS